MPTMGKGFCEVSLAGAAGSGWAEARGVSLPTFFETERFRGLSFGAAWYIPPLA